MVVVVRVRVSREGLGLSVLTRRWADDGDDDDDDDGGGVEGAGE